MMKKGGRISDANLEIMNYIWEKGEATISEVLEAANARRPKNLKRATIQVQVRRLEKYGWLSHREVNRTFVYFPIKDGETAKVDIMKGIRKRVFDGSCLDLVKCLISGGDISNREIHRIEEFLRSERER
ncbi:MAG: BlaI/MecI/CopY family transcriptional regulator [Candidatus Aminicenantales bacterium]